MVHPQHQAKFDLVRAAKERPCADCGSHFPYYVMDLDHRPDETKRFIISNYSQYGLQAVRDELAKCDTVCANCHRERTHQRGYRNGWGAWRATRDGAPTDDPST